MQTSKIPAVTVDQFVNFLNNEQRDPRLNEILYPLYNERTAQRLINQHEPNPEMAKQGNCALFCHRGVHSNHI